MRAFFIAMMIVVAWLIGPFLMFGIETPYFAVPGIITPIDVFGAVAALSLWTLVVLGLLCKRHP